MLVVLDMRMVVVEVSGAYYLLPGIRRNTCAFLVFPGRPLVPDK